MDSGGNPLQPYLSFVVTTRNDDHGGTLLRRTQTFLNALLAQCKRRQLPSELIIVEWNPPADRPPLREALEWPEHLGPCAVRFIEVSAAVHERYVHAESMPLYQMIAKNAGIRRARGQFVVATNIDILFNDEIFRYFAERRLEAGKMYRIDRYDVLTDVPVNAPVEEQLAYCESHLLRMHAREGSFQFDADGRRALEARDVASPEDGIRFGPGWFGVEWNIDDEALRFAGPKAELQIEMRPGRRVLQVELEPWNGVHRRPFMLQARNEAGELFAECWVKGRSLVRLQVPEQLGAAAQIYLQPARGGAAAPGEPRILNFLIYQIQWDPSQTAMTGSQLTASPKAKPDPGRGLAGWVRTAISEIRKQHPDLSAPARFPLVLRYLLASIYHRGGIVGVTRLLIRSWTRPANIVRKAAGYDIFEQNANIYPGQNWYDVERFYGETFRWVGNDAELYVHRPSAENTALRLYVEPGPGFGGKPFELTALDGNGRRIAAVTVSGLQQVEIPVPGPPDSAQFLTLHVEGGGAAAKHDPRILNFSVFWCGWNGPAVREVSGHESDVILQRIETEMQKRAGIHYEPAVHLHTNACGDFTLLARENWFDLRGYPEFDMYSFHIDSLFCHAAHHGGAVEEVLPDPMRIYHIEHSAGSGWTPEGESKLFARLREKRINWIEYRDLVQWATQMRNLHSPMIFNRDNWGLGGFDLPEGPGL